MSKEYLAALQAAERAWEAGQAIVEAALRQAERGEQWEDTPAGLNATRDELLDHLREIPRRISNLDTARWHPWRAGVIPIREAWDLEQACQVTVDHKRPINWTAVNEWAASVRAWFSAGVTSLTTNPTPELAPPLELIDVDILELLAHRKGVAVSQVDITFADRKIIGLRMRYLASCGYATNPPGKRTGWVITPDGLARLNELPAID